MAKNLVKNGKERFHVNVNDRDSSCGTAKII